MLSTLPTREISGKNVLLRADFNVPLKDGEISDDTRIRETLPTITKIIEMGASLTICSHLGRPKGEEEKYSLEPVAKKLAELLQKEIIFVPDVLEKIELKSGGIALLQNTRYYEEEEENDKEFSKKLAEGYDFFINDAFGTAHRAHASNVGVTAFLPSAAGLLLEREIEVLRNVVKNPEKPLVIMVGGAKMKTKIGVLEHFAEKAQTVLIGGGIANTFLAAQGGNVGNSLYEKEEIPTAKQIIKKTEKSGCKIVFMIDCVVAKEVREKAETRNIPVSDVADDDKILDIGIQTAHIFAEKIENAAMFLWNGPAGLFEMKPFQNGTKKITDAAAKMNGKAILGGGDTLDAVAKFGYSKKDFYHLSTGGGAMLTFLEGGKMPGIEALR